MNISLTPNGRRESGIVLIGTLLASFMLAGLVVSLLTVTTSTSQHQLVTEQDLKLQYLTEAAIRSAVVDLTTGGSGNIGSATNPIEFDGEPYFAITTDNDDGTFTVTAVAISERRRKTIQALIRRTGGVFANGIYAGNSSGDPNYMLEFGGTGATADYITGDIYSGGDIEVWGEASISGTLRSGGTITGMSGEENTEQPPPDIGAMRYETSHDINVAAEFDSFSFRRRDDAGGIAGQLPEDYASHIFRKNPDDRLREISGTVKDDYFLEDPYEPVRRDAEWDGSDAYEITFSGTGSEPGPNSLDKVFFIDGNMWIHNQPTYSFKVVNADGRPIRATFVVKGNIYISDNLFYEDMNRDGIALIAINDEDVTDSGNIYFGDPRGGTLETMHSYMYAENNFFDNNLDNAGSDEVILYGTMSAGNQVAINRDFTSQRTRFELNFDDRLRDGALELPGIPGARGELKFSVVGTHEATNVGSVSSLTH